MIVDRQDSAFARVTLPYAQTMPVQDLLTTEQVAAELSVTASRVRQLVRDGQLKPEEYTPRVHLFRREVVEAYKLSPKPQRGRPRKC